MRVRFLVFAGALLLQSGLVFAEDATPAGLAEDVAGIRHALERLVVLLDGVQQRQDAELLIRRIELKERRIEPLSARLRDAEREVNGLQDEIRRFGGMVADLETAIDEAVRQGTDQLDSPERSMLSQVLPESRRLAEQLEIAELRRREAEDRLAYERKEIELLDNALLELLE